MVFRWIFVALFSMWFGGQAYAAEWVNREDTRGVFEAPPPIPREFDTVPGIYMDVHGHPEQYALLLELSRYGSKALPRLADTLGVPIGGKVTVIVASSDEEFRSLQPGRPPEWADATAWPESGTIFLRTPGVRGDALTPLEAVFDHELVHVLVGRAFHPYQPPRWLHEGLARSFAGESGPETSRVLASGLLTGSVRPFSELNLSFPEDPRAAQLAYAQSTHFVTWIRAKYGDAAIQRLIRELATGSSLDEAVREATGLSLSALEDAWKTSLSSGTPMWLSAVGGEEMVWAGVGLLAFGATFAKYRRTRRRIEKMASDEADLEARIAAARAQAIAGGWWDERQPVDWSAPIRR